MMKPRTCCICGQVDTFLFRSPKDPSLRKKWARFCQLSRAYTTSILLCEKHFTTDCFKVNDDGIRKELISGTIPSLTPPMPYQKGVTRNMRKKCFLCGNTKDSAYYKWPKDPVRKEEWAKICNVELHQLEKYTIVFVCSKHFSKEDIVPRTKMKGRSHLRYAAIPKLNCVNESIKEATVQFNNADTKTKTVEHTESESIRVDSEENSIADVPVTETNQVDLEDILQVEVALSFVKMNPFERRSMLDITKRKLRRMQNRLKLYEHVVKRLKNEILSETATLNGMESFQ